MHVAAIIIGIVLILVCGTALRVVLRDRAGHHRRLEEWGLEKPRLPVRADAMLFFAAHTVGVIAGLGLILWGLHGV